MKQDTDQLFEELCKNHPDLMKKSQQEYFGVGPGWFNLIDVLCGGISRRVNMIRQQLKYALENQNSKFAKPIIELEADLHNEIEALPVIVQIKEKFGGLRFYVDGATDEVDNYIAFAEQLSNRICEECGAPGTHRDNGWIRTLCDKHANPEVNVKVTSARHGDGPKLSDE